jgi:hypothetical protein
MGGVRRAFSTLKALDDAVTESGCIRSGWSVSTPVIDLETGVDGQHQHVIESLPLEGLEEE